MKDRISAGEQEFIAIADAGMGVPFRTIGVNYDDSDVFRQIWRHEDPEIVDLFKRRGWRVEVRPQETGSMTLGRTKHDERTIVCFVGNWIQDEGSKYFTANIIYDHELGHFLDDELTGRFTRSALFKNCAAADLLQVTERFAQQNWYFITAEAAFRPESLIALKQAKYLMPEGNEELFAESFAQHKRLGEIRKASQSLAASLVMDVTWLSSEMHYTADLMKGFGVRLPEFLSINRKLEHRYGHNLDAVRQHMCAYIAGTLHDDLTLSVLARSKPKLRRESSLIL